MILFLQGTFALGRLIAIPCATRLTAAFMLSCNLVNIIYLLYIGLFSPRVIFALPRLQMVSSHLEFVHMQLC